MASVTRYVIYFNKWVKWPDLIIPVRPKNDLKKMTDKSDLSQLITSHSNAILYMSVTGNRFSKFYMRA